MNLDLSEFSANQIYHLMTQSVIPRPIAWALTDSGQAGSPNYNLAPFSYFAPVCSQPPLLMISVGNKAPGVPKDTVKNIVENNKMVIHIAHQDQYREVTGSAATLEHGVSEVEQQGLELVEFNGFCLPRLASSDIAFGCELHEIKELGDAPQHLVFVEVKQIYLSENVATKNEEGRISIDPTKVQPLARLGAALYSELGSVFSQKRPD